jgi:hypothetical protein
MDNLKHVQTSASTLGDRYRVTEGDADVVIDVYQMTVWRAMSQAPSHVKTELGKRIASRVSGERRKTVYALAAVLCEAVYEVISNRMPDGVRVARSGTGYCEDHLLLVRDDVGGTDIPDLGAVVAEATSDIWNRYMAGGAW